MAKLGCHDTARAWNGIRRRTGDQGASSHSDLHNLFDVVQDSNDHNLAGLLAILTTPLGLAVAWGFRRSLNRVATGFVCLAVFGFVAFVLAYANPFYHE
jgi:hypothetical protein